MKGDMQLPASDSEAFAQEETILNLQNGEINTSTNEENYIKNEIRSQLETQTKKNKIYERISQQ